ncbi:hypothetical protein AB0890_02270 [Streptomyces sp. NPDC005406]|uniref:hypothetical protein n=1 Tax=Streptomyces sp. NPDC005406 TaxID=3155339 RepID=UPI00345602F3
MPERLAAQNMPQAHRLPARTAAARPEKIRTDDALLEWAGSDMTQESVAVSFRFLDHQVTIANALEENGLTLGPPESGYRRHSLR